MPTELEQLEGAIAKRLGLEPGAAERLAHAIHHGQVSTASYRDVLMVMNTVAVWLEELGKLPPPKTEQPSITCPRCGLTSSNANDIAQKYCGNCHQFHDQMQFAEGGERG